MLAHVRCVLFDLDGTLTVPVLDFADIRARLRLPPGESIVHALARMPLSERQWREDLLRQIELEAAHAAEPNAGAVELVRALQARDIGVAVITRNFGRAARVTLDTLGIEVAVVISREDAEPKPSAQPLLLALRTLAGTPDRALMVGDFDDDMRAGRAAGTRTCLITNGAPPRFDADLYADSPGELLAAFEAAWAAG
ncbi:MAG: HAD family hydrolase [Planctomycetes bacterium]|nr:HAD family hydrolase [Planctomycetota bacterium]MCL4730129.1 HAD family hydrolase [Planctomycetota bacterium]